MLTSEDGLSCSAVVLWKGLLDCCGVIYSGSLGGVRDIYMLYKQAGDEYVGRVLSGLDVMSYNFAVKNVLPSQSSRTGIT